MHRSARLPTGTLTTAPAMELVVTRSPSPVLSRWRERSSWTASAPIAPLLAPLRARTAARRTTVPFADRASQPSIEAAIHPSPHGFERGGDEMEHPAGSGPVPSGAPGAMSGSVPGDEGCRRSSAVAGDRDRRPAVGAVTVDHVVEPSASAWSGSASDRTDRAERPSSAEGAEEDDDDRGRRPARSEGAGLGQTGGDEEDRGCRRAWWEWRSSEHRHGDPHRQGGCDHLVPRGAFRRWRPRDGAAVRR